MKETHIAVLAYAGISPFHLAVPFTVFGEDRREIGVPRFRVTACAAEEAGVPTSAGYGLSGLSGLAEAEKAGIVIVPGWRDPFEEPPHDLVAAVRRARGRGAILVGLCLGAYVLAAAGVLDGRTATTHWAWADELARRYPEITVKREVLYVDEGEVVTSAGCASGIDCCLYLLQRLAGAEIAARVARRLVVPLHRQGGQAQYIEAMPPPATGDRFHRVMERVRHQPGEAYTLDSLAREACMSRRSFTRKFRLATGTSVSSWLRDQRLALARRLLETGDLGIDQVASEAGFGSEVAMRKQFAKRLATTPGRYRREFRGK